MNFFNINDLEKRNIPVIQKGVRIVLKKREPLIEEDTSIEEKNQPFVLKDYRTLPTNVVNRKLLLERLHMTLPKHNEEVIIPKTIVSKSPIVEKEEVLMGEDEKDDLIDEDKDDLIDEQKEDVTNEDEQKEDVTNEDEEDDLVEEEQKEEKVKRPRKKKEQMKVPDEAPVNLMSALIKGKPLMKRLPKPSKLKISVSQYYMNNRKIFIDKLSKMFKPYQAKIEERGAEISCKTARNEDIDFELLTHQLIVRDYLNTYTPYRGLLLFHGLGSGKCHKKGTPIMMSDGTIKLIEDINVGELLMGDDSKPRTVLSLARGIDKMYDVIPVKGEKYTVNSEHILCLRVSGFPKISSNNHTSYNVQWVEDNKFMSKIFTFNEINNNQVEMKIAAESFFNSILENPNTNDNVIEIAIKDYLNLSNKKKELLKGYKVPVEFPEKELPIDPYMIGYWLGDRTSIESSFTTQDSTVLYYFNKNVNKYNLLLKYRSEYIYDITGNDKKNNNFYNSLKNLNLINNKHIPMIYKCNSRENQLKLLAGLLDSAGCLSNNGFEFTQKNETLLNDVIYLARSLGFSCYKSTKKISSTYKGEKNEEFRININGNGIEEIPTLIPRKQAFPRKQMKDVLVTGIKVEYVNEDDYYGFTLDGNCRYVMGDFTVTHNTCTSIGIAEGMKTNKEIILMTPASLKVNFFSELKKCGDILYKKNQYWEFISIDGQPQNIAILSQVLSLPQKYIREHGGAWLVNITKKSNFKTLSDNDQKNIDEQLNTMIRAKYKDYNYNGLRDSQLNKMTENGKINPFDHKVVIIDEVHNLVSRISNSRGDTKSISQRLYRYLLSATDCKIVFLTGTPIINQPSEIGILFNMLRGGIKTWKFAIRSEKKVTKAILMDVLKENRFVFYDYIEYSGDTLTITRNPFGFISTYSKPRDQKRGGSGKKTIKKSHNKKRKTRKTREPITEFKEKNGIIKQTFFDKPSDELVDETIDQIKKTEYYAGGGTPFEDYRGVQYDENGNISDIEFERKLLHILTDNGFTATPIDKEKGKKGEKGKNIETCLPEDPKVFNENFINNNTGEIENIDLFKRRILGLTSYFRSAQEELLPSFEKTENGENYHIVPVPMSDYQFSEYQKIRSDERKQEKQKNKNAKKAKNQEDDEELPSSYRIYSRSSCNFCFPEEYPRPKVSLESGKDINENIFNGLTKQMRELQDDYIEGEDVINKDDEEIVVNYQKRIKDALDYLASSGKLLAGSEDGLDRFSPKFAKILENIQNEEYRGLHLLYSQFRTLEGIGILKLILEKNGFVEFKISKSGGDWIIENFDVDQEKPRFVLYTGTETAEEKEIIRNIYNSAWELVPPSIVSVLKRRHENNIYGEIIKLFMITSSGAEGINLRNTRYVHVVEPYWNMVRIDQVVGRARRICSHEDLPEELRTVKVMIYIARLTDKQIQSDGNIEMKLKDISKREYEVREHGKTVKKRLVFTTDEYLFEIAQIKDSIHRQILTAVKETAMDCSLYNKNPDEPLICYGYGSVTKNDFGSYPIFDVDKAYNPTLEVAKKTTQLVTIELDGIKYKMNAKTNVVYSMESYDRMKTGRGDLDAVGKLVTVTEMVSGEKMKVPKIVAL